MFLLNIILGGIIGAIGFRVRGGLWNDKIKWGATTARLVAWSLPMSLITYTAFQFNQPLWYIPIFILTWWVGCLLGWWHSIDMGRLDGNWTKDFILQSIRGLFWTLPTAIAVCLLTQSIPISMIILLVSGLSCGICYEIGWRLSEKKPIMGGTEYGEFIFGLVIGATTPIAIMLI